MVFGVRYRGGIYNSEDNLPYLISNLTHMSERTNTLLLNCLVFRLCYLRHGSHNFLPRYWVGKKALWVSGVGAFAWGQLAADLSNNMFWGGSNS